MRIPVCTYWAIPRTTKMEPETDTDTETENGKRKWERNLQYTRLWPEHAYTFVCTRYLLRLCVRILLGHMAFPLPPKTLLRWDDDS